MAFLLEFLDIFKRYDDKLLYTIKKRSRVLIQHRLKLKYIFIFMIIQHISELFGLKNIKCAMK